MKTGLRQIDWGALKYAIVTLVVSGLLGLVAVFASQHYLVYLQQWELEQRNQLGQAQTKYSQVAEALEIVNHFYYDNFNDFIKQGFFQEVPISSWEEQRLNMVGEIKNLIPKLKLPGIAEYELLAQEIFSPPFIVENEFKVYKSQLILKLGLLHEEDMLNLVKSIRFQKFAGLLSWQKCELQRTDRALNLKEASGPYLQAICGLTWYVSTLEKIE